MDAALEVGIPWLTLFGFSTENWQRGVAEMNFVTDLIHTYLPGHADSYAARGVRVRFLGRRDDDRMPQALIRDMHDLEMRTQGNDRLTLTLAINHGGRAELVDAMRSMLATGMAADEITEQTVTQHMQFPDMPDLDLLLRTAGEQRLSNFMLWRTAYTELVFIGTLWPDFRREHLLQALDVYRSRERRFGALP